MSEPVLVGLLFADRIITENNGKKGIIGTFNRFMAPQFPVVFPPWAVYAAVTNITGSHQFALNLVHADTGQVVVPISGGLDVKDSVDVVELAFDILGAVFPHEGRYMLSLMLDGELLGSRVLLVSSAPVPPAHGQ